MVINWNYREFGKIKNRPKYALKLTKFELKLLPLSASKSIF